MKKVREELNSVDSGQLTIDSDREVKSEELRVKSCKSGYKMTELGEIPEEWNLKSLREVVNINPESLGNKTNKDYIFNYIDIESVSTGVINNTKEYSFEEAPSRARRKVKKNDVIISTVRPYLKAFAIIKDDRENLVCSTGFAVLRVKEDVDFQYIYQYTLSDSFLNQLSNKMVGSNYPAVNSTDVQEAIVPVPTFREQQKISLILSSVDEQIEITDNLIEKTKELKKGLMQRLLTEGIGHSRFKETEIGRIPEEWEVVKFGSVIELLTDYEANGSFSDIKNNVKIYDEPQYAYFVRATDLEKKNYVSSVKYVDKDSYEFLRKTKLEGGELLITKRGEIGKVYLMPYLNRICTLAPNLYLIKIKEDIVVNKFLYYFFTSNLGQKYLIRNSASTTLGALYKDDVKKINIVIPKVKEQKAIVEILSSIDGQIAQYESKKEKFQEFKKGLMQKLLTGKIRVKLN